VQATDEISKVQQMLQERQQLLTEREKRVQEYQHLRQKYAQKSAALKEVRHNRWPGHPDMHLLP